MKHPILQQSLFYLITTADLSEYRLCNTRSYNFE